MRPFARCGEKLGDEYLAQLGRYRARMVPREGWPATLMEFDRRWTEYKADADLMDFTDLIEACLEDVRVAPGNPAVIFADEAQDFTRLEFSLVRQWGRNAQYFVAAGDDDQCSVEGTMVETTVGPVPVEELNPTTHRLLAYSREGVVYGFQSGYEFDIQSRPVAEEIFDVSAGGKTTGATANHIWLIRWNRTEQNTKKCCVYLMRRGDRFRVGWCQMFRSDGCFHLGVRATGEKAEHAWVLKTFDNRTEASIYESLVAARFGIPTIPFEPVNGATHITHEAIDSLFTQLGSAHVWNAAHRCLDAHGLSMVYPLWAADAVSTAGSRTFKCRSINLLTDGIMQVPVWGGNKTVEWAPLCVRKRWYEGVVYGLDVDTHHTYIADGIVTHNCIFSFSGASPDPLVENDVPDQHKIVLKQSYRVPRKVQAAAERLIQTVSVRQEKQYLPRDEEGHVGSVPHGGWKNPIPIIRHAEEELSRGHSVMFLASCSYLLQPLIKELRAAGIPFANRYRVSNGAWNPLRRDAKGSAVNRLTALLAPHPEAGTKKVWSFGDLALWAEWLEAKGVMRHGAKKRLADADHQRIVLPEDLVALFEERAVDEMIGAFEAGYQNLLDWWQDHLSQSFRPRAEFATQIAKRRGLDALFEEPRVTVGTIHSVKGGEADVVYLIPDLSRAGWAEYEKRGEPKDSVVRLFYVGMTRARKQLLWCQQTTPMSFRG
jgi:hypothetical protein